MLHDYTIYPRKNMTTREASEVESAICSTIGVKKPLEGYTSNMDGTTYWFAFLSTAQVLDVKKLDGVSVFDSALVGSTTAPKLIECRSMELSWTAKIPTPGTMWKSSWMLVDCRLLLLKSSKKLTKSALPLKTPTDITSFQWQDAAW